MYTLGLDIGSTTSKCVILEDGTKLMGVRGDYFEGLLQVDALRGVIGPRDVADGDDLDPGLRQRLRRVAADVAEPLDGRPNALRVLAQDLHQLEAAGGDAAARGLVAPPGAPVRDRLARKTRPAPTGRASW